MTAKLFQIKYNSLLISILCISLFIPHHYVVQCVNIGFDQACKGAPLEYRQTDNATYIIGGLFPLHYYNKENKVFEYHSTGLMWVESMMFAIKEINQREDLLPNITLGYRIFDSCGNIGIALESTLQLLNGDTRVRSGGNGTSGELYNQGGRLLSNNLINDNTTAFCKCEPSLDTIVGLVGDAPSSTSAKVAALLSASKTPQISYSSTSTDLSNKELFPSFMRTLPPDNFQAIVMADLMKHFNWTYINIVACDNLYGRVGVDELLPHLKHNGVCVAVLAVIDVRNDDGKLIKQTVQRLKKETEATVVILWCQSIDAMRVLRTAEDEKLYHRTWIATESYGSSSKVYSINPQVVSGMFGIIPAQASYQLYAESLKTITPNNSDDNPWLEEYWVTEKKCKKINHDEVRGLSSTKPKYQCPDKITNLEKLPTKKYINVFDAVYAMAHGLHNYLQSNHTGPEYTNSSDKVSINATLLNQYVKSVNFTGKSNATVSFNTKGNPAEARYSITNVQYNPSTNTLTHVKIADWNYRMRNIIFQTENFHLSFANFSSKSPSSSCAEICKPGFYGLRFGDKPCCWKCVPCRNGEIQPNAGKDQCIKCEPGKMSNREQTICIEPKINYLEITSSTGLVILVLMICCYLLMIVCVVIFYIKRHTPIVKASNKGLTRLQITSMFFQLAIPVLYLQWKQTSTLLCGIRLFYFIFFTIVTISVIFIKADHLLRIFELSRRNSKLKGNQMQYFTIAVLTIVGLALGTVMYILYKPKAVREIQYLSNPVTITHHCSDGSYDIVLFSMVAYNVAISLVCSIYAFKARKLPHDYNEARFTSFAMFTFMLVWLMAVPIYFSRKNKVDRAASWCILCILSTIVIFIPMYLPKVYLIIFKPEKNTVECFRKNLKRDIGMKSHSSSSFEKNTV